MAILFLIYLSGLASALPMNLELNTDLQQQTRHVSSIDTTIGNLLAPDAPAQCLGSADCADRKSQKSCLEHPQPEGCVWSER